MIGIGNEIAKQICKILIIPFVIFFALGFLVAYFLF
jgi:hypothetical protein